MNKKYYPIYRIYLTHCCNSNCVFCDTHQDEYKNIKEMSLKKLKEIIDEAKSYGCEYIDFTGGQPLLYSHLSEALKYCQELGIFSEVTTNCIDDYDDINGYSKVFLDCLKYASQINISLDSLKPEVFKSIRGVNTLSNTKKVIEHLPLEYKNKVKIIYTLTSSNIVEVVDIMNYAKQNNILVYFNPMFNYGRISNKINDELDINKKINNCLLDYMYDPYSMVHIHFLDLQKDVFDGKKIHCGANRRIITIMANGQVASPCYHASKRKISDIKISDIEDDYMVCDKCFVSSYFDYGVEYWLNNYSLLRGVSACFDKLKSHIRKNNLSLNIDVNYLNKILLSYIKLIKDFNGYYDINSVMKSDISYDLRIYKDNNLKDIEHTYDVYGISKTPIKTAIELLDILLNKENLKEFINEIPELILRWFRLYSAKYFKDIDTKYLVEDKKWISDFLSNNKINYLI